MNKSIVLIAIVATATSLAFNTANAGNDRDEHKSWGRPFQTILKKIHGLEKRIDDLEEENTALKARLSCLSGESDAYDVFFDGCNVHVRNGAGQTASKNDLGNLIVGYNEDTDGTTNDRSGSHNLVIGQEHTYSSYGGLVAGLRNSVTARNATVSGGFGNRASGEESSVSAGIFNAASAIRSSVSGGVRNEASAFDASVSGGDGCNVNVARGWGVGDIDSNTTGCLTTNLP